MLFNLDQALFRWTYTLQEMKGIVWKHKDVAKAEIHSVFARAL